MNPQPSLSQTARFAEFVESFRYEQIPAGVLARTKDVIYDGIGALLSATSPNYDLSAVLGRFVKETGGAPESQVFGSSLRTNCVTAALVNGASATPVTLRAIMPALSCMPSPWSVRRHLRSESAWAAQAGTYSQRLWSANDAACRMSYALGGPALYARGFHPTCVAGTFGSLSAAARLFGLKGRSLLHAFSLAGTEASGLLAWVSDLTEHSRPFNMGLASRHGVFAAHLALCGFGEPPAIFEGKYPIGQAFTGQWRENELFDGLGERFKVMELYFKLYACCAFIHPALDGLLDILETERVEPSDISRISLRFPKDGYKVIDNNALRSHCAQYVLALGAYKREIEFYDILHDQRSDPAIRSLSERIGVVGDDETNKTYPDLYRSIITVELRGDATHIRDISHPKGSPEQPVTREVLERKFVRLTSGVVDTMRAKQIAEAVDHIDELKDIGELTRLLTR